VRDYLAIERIRFGDRLRTSDALDPAALACRLPAFALQTLVENAVRHAAAPRVEPTTLAIVARIEDGALVVSVSDDGPGADLASIVRSTGTGLRRLREQLKWLHGGAAALALTSEPGAGFNARLSVPRNDGLDADELDE
jgi:LytS/YehU family sensor histidine kinase